MHRRLFIPNIRGISPLHDPIDCFIECGSENSCFFSVHYRLLSTHQTQNRYSYTKGSKKISQKKRRASRLVTKPRTHLTPCLAKPTNLVPNTVKQASVIASYAVTLLDSLPDLFLTTSSE